MNNKLPKEKKQMNYKLISIALVTILLCIGGVYAYQTIQDKAYQQGVQDANLFLNEQIISQLNSQGYINFQYPINETTATNLRLGVIPEQ